MSVCELPASEFVETLNGFEEIGIRQEFGLSITAIEKADAMQFIRALVFVHRRRAGDKSREAHDFAQSLTIREVGEFFADETDDDVAVESGKDE